MSKSDFNCKGDAHTALSKDLYNALVLLKNSII